MKRSVFNIITAILAVVYAGILICGNVFYKSTPVAVVPGSYAETFAQKNSLETIQIPDSDAFMLDIRYETLDYNINDYDNICIEGYNGKSKELVIPSSIGGRLVTEIGENFFNTCKSETIYLPVTMMDIKASPISGIKLLCDEDSVFYQENYDNKDWNIDVPYDSEYINFSNADIPFSYNENADTVELVEYNGTDRTIAIPSHINGKPVTSVQFDMLNRFGLVIFPDTVTSITGRLFTLQMTGTFLVELIFTIIAFIAVIIAVNVLLPRYNKGISEYMLNGSQMVLSLLYLIIQIVLSAVVIYGTNIPTMIAFIISVVLLALYLIFIFAAGAGRKSAMKVEAKVSEQTSLMHEIKKLAGEISYAGEDKDIKKYVEDIKDGIKFSTAKSTNEEAENAIKTQLQLFKDAIENKDTDKIKETGEQIQKLLRQR